MKNDSIKRKYVYKKGRIFESITTVKNQIAKTKDT